LEEVLSDLKATGKASVDQLHALAPPFAGRWFTKPIDPAIALELMARQFEARLEEDSLFYLEAAMWKSAGGPKGVLGEELVQKHYAFARRYKAEVEPERAAAHFERALVIAPSARIYHDYGTMLASHGKLIQAKELLKKALILEPNLKPTLGALALVNKLIAEGK
jgi:tetratricopeptide (TPR) repeat protein